MKTKTFYLSLIAIFTLSISAQAQTSVNATGGNASGSGGSVSYSIGQVVYTSNTGSEGSVDQGVQHPYEIFTIGINETTLDISLVAYPNPTTENLILQINDYNNEKLLYQLFDMQGKELSKEQIVAQQTLIDMSSLPTATYFINVVNQENRKVQSFKIVKIK